ASLSYYGWDQSTGSAGSKVSVETRGGTTAFSAEGDTATLGVTDVADAPVVANAIPDCTASEEALFTYTFAANTFTDGDAGDILSYGALQSNGSSLPTWLGFDTATRTFSGTPQNEHVGFYDITVTATDSTSRSVTDTFRITATNVNDAPVLSPATPTLTSITEDATSNDTNGGQTVASILDSRLSDVDASAVEGIALYGVTGSYGTWQYRLNGDSRWSNVGTVSSSSALLLKETDFVRWLPDGSQGTTAILSYYGWDQSTGSAGSKVSVETRGGTTAFSTVGDTATLMVASVNDAPTFTLSGDGKVTTAIGTGAAGESVTVQADGKILVAGFASNGSNADFALVRYNTDGSLDTRFGTGGKVTTAIGTGSDWGESVTVQTDGKILVAGDAGGYFGLVRYNTDGSLDTSFDGDGKVTTDIGTGYDYGYSVTVQADGKILVAGSADIGGNYNFALVRYNTNGSLDISFDSDGKLTTKIGSDDVEGKSVVVQTDGKILVTGETNSSYTGFAL
ncbi:hypothetical protein FJY94_09220, partial [Candidatus Kaiserbacteria bacterium]|nr:hypothetical protein [Candidatus Kaiserbacteria bacterium]